MMYSGKPPFKSFINAGIPGKDASAGVEGLTQQRPPTSENCDPNLAVDKKEALRKAESPSLLDESHRSAGNGSILHLPKPDAGIAGSECATASELGRQSKEVSRSTKSSLPSPTKIPVGHQHGHGPRHHFCRSPRCASNNPEYATPAQPAPRKYLVSKRHLLPGAICSKDPAILASQTQESAIPPAPSTGKPPKPSRQLENVFRQPSFTNASDRKTAPLAYETSPTRIPKPPFSRSPVRQQSATSPNPLSSAVSPSAAPASDSHFSSCPAAPRQLERSLGEEEIPQERLAESDLDRLVHSRHVGSESSCTIAVESISSPASDLGESSEASVSGNQLESSVTSAGDEVLISRLPSPERPTPSNCAEMSDSNASDHLSPEPELPIFAATSFLMPLFTEVEDVTKRLEQKLVFENVEEPSPPATDSNKREEICSAIPPEGLKAHAEDSNPSCEQDADEQLSKSDSGLRIDKEDADDVDCQEEGNADGEDYRSEKVADAEDHQAEKHAVGEDLQDQQNVDEEDLQDGQNVDGGDCQAQGTAVEGDYQAEKNAAGGNCHQPENNVDGEDYQPLSDMHGFDNALSWEDNEGQETPQGRSIASYIEEFESAAQSRQTERQCEVPKYVRGKGRQIWRSDCRDSREVVFLKQTPQADQRDGDWMVDSILEGAISKLNPSGQGRVRVLVEAFESLMNLGGDIEAPGRRASRVWCLNRMEKGEVDEDGEEFEDGDQRVDCYEVSGDALQLRASMRLSLGGGNRLPLYNPDEVDEIEMSAIQKVQEWDDDCRQSSSFEDLDGAPRVSQRRPEGPSVHDQKNCCEVHSEDPEFTFGDIQRRISFTESHTVLNETDRSSEDFSCDAQTKNQFGSYSSDGGRNRTDASSTFSLDFDWKHKACRRRRYWKASPVNLEPPGASEASEGAEKDQKVIKGTLLEPFNLLTEERGMMKEYQFSKKLEQILAEEERLRNPVAQGLPWTTDEPEIPRKPAVKEQTRPVEFRHYSNSRAIERADFDNYVSERSAYMEMRRQEEDRMRQLAEEEEIKRLRREMVPRAQLMPFFDQPFIPTRSSKRLTVPKEPTFLNRQHKRAKCIVWQQQQQHHQPLLTQTYDRPHVFN